MCSGCLGTKEERDLYRQISIAKLKEAAQDAKDACHEAGLPLECAGPMAAVLLDRRLAPMKFWLDRYKKEQLEAQNQP